MRFRLARFSKLDFNGFLLLFREPSLPRERAVRSLPLVSYHVNYPLPEGEGASCFNATCLLLKRVRSLTVAPHVYSQVPYEVLLSYTDNTNIQLISLVCNCSYLILRSPTLRGYGFYGYPYKNLSIY